MVYVFIFLSIFLGKINLFLRFKFLCFRFGRNKNNLCLCLFKDYLYVELVKMIFKNLKGYDNFYNRFFFDILKKM